MTHRRANGSPPVMVRFAPALSILFSAFLALSVLIVRAIPGNAQIDAASTGLQSSAQTAGYGATPVDVPVVIGRIINIGIGILGLLLFLYIIYGGFLWMTAAGDSGKIEKAQGMIFNAVIGVLVVLSAYAIANFIINQLTNQQSGILNP